jgi:hypothetical protein
MKNSVICPNCKTENPFFNFICNNCRVYLRDRIFNLDLWSTISSIIETPSKAFKTIILSEHKNFIFFILFFIGLKYLINARFISMLTMSDFRSTTGLQYSYLIVLGATITYFVSFSILYTVVGKRNDIYLRFKDTFAIIIYSQIPYLFGLVFLFTLELVLFGDYLFSKNPTPFIIKGFFAYLFLILEVGIIIWSIFLVIKAFLTQSQKKLFSILTAIAFTVLFWSLMYFCSIIVFTV